MTKHLPTVVSVVVVAAAVTILLMPTTAASAEPACREAQGCSCYKSSDNKSRSCFLDCRKNTLKGFAHANLTLGRVERLHLEYNCKIEGVPLVDLLRPMNIEGLVNLKIFKASRLEGNSFQGFQPEFPDFRQLDLESVDSFEGDFLRPLGNLETLSFRSCKLITPFPEDLLLGLGNLRFFQVKNRFVFFG